MADDRVLYGPGWCDHGVGLGANDRSLNGEIDGLPHTAGIYTTFQL